MNLVPVFILLYGATGGLYFTFHFVDIYDTYGFWGLVGFDELLVIVFIVTLWLPFVLIEHITCWTVDATYNMVKWFVLKGQIDKDGFEKEDFA